MFVFKFACKAVLTHRKRTNVFHKIKTTNFNLNRHIYKYNLLPVNLFTRDNSQQRVLTGCQQLQCIDVVVNSREQSWRHFSLLRLFTKKTWNSLEQWGIKHMHVHLTIITRQFTTKCKQSFPLISKQENNRIPLNNAKHNFILFRN